MRKTKVVELGEVRDLLTEFERARQAFFTGRYKSFFLQLQDEDDRDTVFLGGVYKTDHNAAARAILKVSAARALAEDDEPPALKAANI